MFTLLSGPMYASKTTSLIDYKNKYNRDGKNALCVNHSIDDRYDDGDFIVSHNNVTMSCVKVDSLLRIEEEHVGDVDVILIDELQFFPQDSVRVISEWTKRGKDVIAAGLLDDFQKEKFVTTYQASRVADKHVKLLAACYNCKKEAEFTKKVGGDQHVRIQVGSDLYKPSCAKCFNL